MRIGADAEVCLGRQAAAGQFRKCAEVGVDKRGRRSVTLVQAAGVIRHQVSSSGFVAVDTYES
jgi:hypothetical protein